MFGNSKISIGCRVKVRPQHWLRAYEEGMVIDWQPRAQNHWLVKFDSSFPGGGIDGDKLWLAESEFAAVKLESKAHALKSIPNSDHYQTGAAAGRFDLH